MFCIQVWEPDLFSDTFQVVERGTPFLQGNRWDGDRKELTVPPHRDRTTIPLFTPDGEGVEIVLHKEQVPAGTAGIDDLIRRIGPAALHAGEAIHALDLSGHRRYTHPVLQLIPFLWSGRVSGKIIQQTVLVYGERLADTMNHLRIDDGRDQRLLPPCFCNHGSGGINGK